METKNLLERLTNLVAKFSVAEATPVVEENIQEVEIKLEEAKLVDGTVIKWNAETMEAVVVLVDAEGNTSETPITVGEYVLEDGKILVVETEGIVKEIKEPEMVEEVEEVPSEMEEKFSQLESVVSKLQEEIEALKAEKKSLETKVEEFSKLPIAEPVNLSPRAEKSIYSDLNAVQKRLLGIK